MIDEKTFALNSGEIEAVLNRNGVSKIAYETSTLYLVSEKDMSDLKKISRRIELASENNVKNPFHYYGKLINPDEAAYKYKHSVKSKYKFTPDQDKVFERLDKTFDIWQKREKKNLEELISDEEIDSERASVLRGKLDVKISSEKDMLNRLIKDFDRYHVVLTSFEDRIYCSNLYYSMLKGGHENEHLRKEVPNILWYEENSRRADTRSDDKQKEFVDNYSRLCSSIYFKKE